MSLNTVNHAPDDCLTVLVLMGGPDAEREVSLSSGREVAAALRESGEFRVVDEVIESPTIFQLKVLASAANADVVFPVLHGRWGEGGPLQTLLERLGLPYVGSPPSAASLAMDKMRTKALVSMHGVPTPAAQELEPGMPCALRPPLVLKPVDDGSSVDLRICRSDEEVAAARAHLHPRRGRLMAEAYIQGRELTVGIVLDQPLPIIEIVPAVEFYDYQAKYHREDTRYVVNPTLPPGVAERCVDIAMTAYRTLGCRDVSRVDIMFDGERPWFLEINTMPGFTTHSLVPMAARATGTPMPALCASMLRAAMRRASASPVAAAVSTARRMG